LSTRPPKYPGVQTYADIGAPNNAIGRDGDLYQRIDTGRLYERIGGVWGLVFQPTLPTNKLTGTIDYATQVSGGPKFTISPFAGGPPGSPSDGDFWIATEVDTLGVRWMFQFNASSLSSYKWEFIGGAPVRSEGGNAAGVTSTAYTDLGPSLNNTRGGDYEIEFGGHMYNAAATNAVWLAVVKGGAAASDNDAVGVENHAIIDAISVAKKTSGIGLAAGTVTKLQVRVGGGQGYYGQCYLHMRPIRVA
jgi:hypothetical protein